MRKVRAIYFDDFEQRNELGDSIASARLEPDHALGFGRYRRCGRLPYSKTGPSTPQIELERRTPEPRSKHTARLVRDIKNTKRRRSQTASADCALTRPLGDQRKSCGAVTGPACTVIRQDQSFHGGRKSSPERREARHCNPTDVMKDWLARRGWRIRPRARRLNFRR